MFFHSWRLDISLSHSLTWRRASLGAIMSSSGSSYYSAAASRPTGDENKNSTGSSVSEYRTLSLRSVAAAVLC